jgi:hypothetical protein
MMMACEGVLVEKTVAVSEWVVWALEGNGHVVVWEVVHAGVSGVARSV